MRGKDFNAGLRGVLFEARHYDRTGSAVWLYAWLVLRQTHQTGTIGWVLGGAPIRYQEIEEETGFNSRTFERWMRILRQHGYIEAESVPGGMIVRITKAKKHACKAGDFDGSRKLDALRRADAGVRKVAEDPRKFADGSPQARGTVSREVMENTQDRFPIGSASLEESIKRSEPPQPTLQASELPWRLANKPWPPEYRNQSKNDFERTNPCCLGKGPNRRPAFDYGREAFARPRRLPREQMQEPQPTRLTLDEARLQLELLRAEREEAVRRELRVGRGPEPCRAKPGGNAPTVSLGESR